MKEPEMIRGYAIPLSAKFLLEDRDVSPAVPVSARTELQRIASAKPDIWMPRADAIRLWQMVDDASPDEAASYHNLTRCGETIANVAINTFLKLLLRVLSPKQFANKFPSIWEHEHKGGHVESSLKDSNHMDIAIRDIEGFRNLGPIARGFILTALRAIGLKELEIQDKTWSRATPAPREAILLASWK